MEIAIALLALIAVPIGLLLWTRRDRNPGDSTNDPHGHLDIGHGGPPLHSQQGWPDSGGGGN